MRRAPKAPLEPKKGFDAQRAPHWGEEKRKKRGKKYIYQISKSSRANATISPVSALLSSLFLLPFSFSPTPHLICVPANPRHLPCVSYFSILVAPFSSLPLFPSLSFDHHTTFLPSFLSPSLFLGSENSGLASGHNLASIITRRFRIRPTWASKLFKYALTSPPTSRLKRRRVSVFLSLLSLRNFQHLVFGRGTNPRPVRFLF